MHLKSLVLKGFKSFADRCVVSLEPGITAVVGPNGSGKSNISDAVLWVLGERNAKNLRGQAMEDVIFAGSSARKSVGIAEVDLVLDNSDGTLPVDFSEVSLTRRMYRSGESEYLINGSPARRMDFMDILHDTGLGTGAHSIIGQGNLDAILASRPEDRRVLIEEAAGVLKHKQRKDRSARKLAAMDAHLARVKDVTAEVERQLKPLARKAARAEAYRGIAEELSALELALAVDDLRILQQRWDELLVREKESAAGIDVARISSEEASAKLEKLQLLLQEKGLYVGDLAAQRGRFHMVLERLEAADMLLSEKARGIDARLAAARDTLSGSARRIARFEEDAAALQERLDETIARRDALASEIDGMEREAGEASQRRKDVDAELARSQALMRACERAMDSAMARRAELQDGLAGRISAKELLEAKRAETASELAETSAELERRLREADDDAARLSELLERSRAASETVEACARSAADARAGADAARRDLQRIEARIAAIEEALRGMRAKNEAAAWVDAHARDIDPEAVSAASCVKAPRELEPLVERLLGDDLSAPCVSDASHAAKVASALVDSGARGFASILFGGGAREASVAGPRLMDRLEYPERMEGALEALIGDVKVCGTLDEALRRAAADPHARYAALDGTMAVPGGAVSVQCGEAGDGMLARERELASLRARRAEAQDSLAAAEEACVRCEEQLDRAKAMSLELSRTHAEHKGASESARAERERLAKRAGALEATLASVTADAAAAAERLSAVQPEIDELARKAEECRRERAELEERLAALSGARAAAAEREQAVQSRLSEARLQCATARERVLSLTREHRERRRDLERAVKAKDRATADAASAEAAARRVGPLHEVLAALKESARAWVDDLAGKAALAQSSSAELSDAIADARAAAADARGRLDAAQGALNDVRVEKGKLEVQVEAAVSAIVQDCGVPLETALSTPAPDDREAAEGEAFKLRRRLKSMGTIDSSAAEEYEAMKQRYDFLAAQVEDVEAARRALRRIVAAIDARMQEQFDATFERVDANFRRIFAQLFPGGSGSLELTGDDEGERLGVEVHAQPRGKRIAKMTLMSGGEKSLTAIALLFAVYSIRHTPFYILDEVEAALDDSNLRRLLAYLATLRHETQLIMITHQRRTMEMADVLYGVSMQADGVTKVVSQRVGDAQRR